MKLKLKFYLRGLGLGIVVTTIIMCIVSSKDNKMTDEEIIARAEELGMIEDTVLIKDSDKEDNAGQTVDDIQSEDAGNESEASSEDLNPEPDTDGAGTSVDDGTSDSGGQLKPGSLLPDSWSNANAEGQSTQSDESGTDTDTETDAPEVTVPENDISFPKVVIISSGEGSYTVSKKLAEIGAVESAEDFDTYLCENGYDKKIRAGTYTIPVGATDEQMAKIVTGAKIEGD